MENFKKPKLSRRTLIWSFIVASLVPCLATIFVFTFPRLALSIMSDTNINENSSGVKYLGVAVMISYFLYGHYIFVAFICHLFVVKQKIQKAFLEWLLYAFLGGLNGVVYGVFPTTFNVAALFKGKPSTVFLNVPIADQFYGGYKLLILGVAGMMTALTCIALYKFLPKHFGARLKTKSEDESFNGETL